ncbi:hypothetical protein [Halobacteriovorax marinus]|uniref:hypothetical protein n=1 Tax=Halobacteriovorax marinus TaxID=97084 RepID=UPI003A90E179
MTNWKSPLILVLSSLLFILALSKERANYRPMRQSDFIRAHLVRMHNIQERESFALSRAFILGDKRSLTKDLKQKFSTLHINHLFTPSGIHFSSFFILFLPLIKSLRKKELKKTALAIELILCLLPFGLNQLYSLKRISTLRITNLIFRKLNFKMSIFTIFLLSFLFDFIFGTYEQSPMSYAFSFLFLGSLLATPKLSSIALTFLSANLFITLFFPSTVSLIGFFLGFIFTSVFSITFPFLFLLYWTSSLTTLDLTYLFFKLYQFLVNSFYKFSILGPSVEIDLIGYALLLIFTIVRKKRFLIFAIILSSNRIYNIPTERVSKNNLNREVRINNWKIKGQKEVGLNKEMSCRRVILAEGHRITCRKIKPKEGLLAQSS